MSKAPSVDLRHRVVAAIEGGMSCRQVKFGQKVPELSGARAALAPHEEGRAGSDRLHKAKALTKEIFLLKSEAAT